MSGFVLKLMLSSRCLDGYRESRSGVTEPLPNDQTGEVSWWGCDLANSKILAYHSDFAQPGDIRWHLVGSEDTNSDGNPDLLQWNAGIGELSRWLLNGTTVHPVRHRYHLGPRHYLAAHCHMLIISAAAMALTNSAGNKAFHVAGNEKFLGG